MAAQMDQKQGEPSPEPAFTSPNTNQQFVAVPPPPDNNSIWTIRILLFLVFIFFCYVCFKEGAIIIELIAPLLDFLQSSPRRENEICEVPPIECPTLTKHFVANSEKRYMLDATQSYMNDENMNDITISYKWNIISIDGDTLTKYLMVSNYKKSKLTLEGYSMNQDAIGKITIELKINSTYKLNDQVLTIPQTCPLITVDIISEPILGIDYGTTYSCISYQLPCDHQKIDNNDKNNKGLKTTIVDLTNNGEYCIPTAIYFMKNGKYIIGHKAMAKLTSDPENVIYDVKRIIGREMNDPEIKLFENKHKFKLNTNGKHLSIVIPNWNREITPEQAVAIILEYLVEIASKKLNIPYVKDVVISVPAYFHNGQRQAMRSACHIASLNPVHSLIEPTSAAIAHKYYGTSSSSSSDGSNNDNVIMTFDFGGGTLDCTLMICVGIQCIVESVEGNSTLGGINFDDVLIDIIAQKLGYKPNNIEKSQRAKYKQIAESTKKALSTNSKWKIQSTKDIEIKNKEGESIVFEITRKEFETHKQTKELIKSMLTVVDATLSTKRMKIDNPDKITILMIGGTSKMPIIKNSLLTKFNENQIKYPNFDPQIMVVQGTSFVGSAMQYYESQFSHKTNNQFSHCHNTELVSISNAIPLSLGFATCKNPTDKECNEMSIIVPKNSNYPQTVTEKYCQQKSKQKSARFRLYEGESTNVKENYFLGNLVIKNLPKRPNDCDNIIVKFTIDENGIAKITAQINEKYIDKDDNNNNYNKVQTQISVASNEGSLTDAQMEKQKDEVISWIQNEQVKDYIMALDKAKQSQKEL